MTSQVVVTYNQNHKLLNKIMYTYFNYKNYRFNVINKNITHIQTAKLDEFEKTNLAGQKSPFLLLDT